MSILIPNNFSYFLKTIQVLVTEYFHVFEKLFSITLTLFFGTINSQVTMYFSVFNNLFIASLDTIRYIIDRHFKLINKLMVKNKTENILILGCVVVTLNLSHYLKPIHYHFYLNQTHFEPLCPSYENSHPQNLHLYRLN